MAKPILTRTEFDDYLGNKNDTIKDKTVMGRANCHAKHLIDIIPILADIVWDYLNILLDKNAKVQVYQTKNGTGNVCWVRKTGTWYVFTYDREFKDHPGKIALLNRSLRGDPICHFDENDTLASIKKKGRNKYCVME